VILSFHVLSYRLSRDMDPQTLLFMETMLEALEDAGHVPSTDGHNKIGLCVGAATNTWFHSMSVISVQI
jgi:acyl transferase domain-containing protein